MNEEEQLWDAFRELCEICETTGNALEELAAKARALSIEFGDDEL